MLAGNAVFIENRLKSGNLFQAFLVFLVETIDSSTMITRIQAKVLNPVVGFLTADVVNGLAFYKRSLDVSRHYQSVLKDSALSGILLSHWVSEFLIGIREHGDSKRNIPSLGSGFSSKLLVSLSHMWWFVGKFVGATVAESSKFFTNAASVHPSLLLASTACDQELSASTSFGSMLIPMDFTTKEQTEIADWSEIGFSSHFIPPYPRNLEIQIL